MRHFIARVGLVLWSIFCAATIGCAPAQEDAANHASVVAAGAAPSTPSLPAPPTAQPPNPAPPPATESPPSESLPSEPPPSHCNQTLCNDPVPPLPEPPPPEFPPPVTCPGNLEENFEVAAVKFHLYTGRRAGEETQNPVVVTTLGESPQTLTLKNYEEYDSGATKPGSTYQVGVYFNDQNPQRSNEFLTLRIGLERIPTQDRPWFLGGLVVEALKKGCAYQDPKQWTPVYFNPFARTWIDVDHPLILSQDDAVAIFETRVGTKEDASSDDSLYGGTPFENRDPELMKATPVLDYETTDAFEAGRSYYYGRSYFAEPQGWAKERNSRLPGKFSELLTKQAPAFFIYSVGEDGVYFDQVRAYLTAPKFQGNSTNPFWGYRAWRDDFWNDDDCWWITSCAASDLEFLFTGQYPEAMSNFGETPSDATALGFLNWAMEHDNPGDQVVTGGWGL